MSKNPFRTATKGCCVLTVLVAMEGTSAPSHMQAEMSAWEWGADVSSFDDVTDRVLDWAAS